MIKMDHARIVYMNMGFYSAQVSDRVTCSIQFLKNICLESSFRINNPQVPSEEDYAQFTKQFLETITTTQDKF